MPSKHRAGRRAQPGVSRWFVRIPLMASLTVCGVMVFPLQVPSSPSAPSEAPDRGETLVADDAPRPLRPRPESVAPARHTRPEATRVRLVVAGSAEIVEIHTGTVEDVLNEASVTLGADDRLQPALDEPVSEWMEIVVERVDIETEVTVEVVAYERSVRETAERPEGEEVVTQAGREGRIERTVQRTLVDGVPDSEVVVAEEFVEPVDEVVEVGVGAAPAPAASPDDADVWDRLAQCESNGNWAANTGNGYHGGLQFHPQTWSSHGGGEFATYAYEASREEQIIVARRVQQSQGWRAWPHCSRAVGLR